MSNSGRPLLFTQRSIPFGQMSRQDLKICIRCPESIIQLLPPFAFMRYYLSEALGIQILRNSKADVMAPRPLINSVQMSSFHLKMRNIRFLAHFFSFPLVIQVHFMMRKKKTKLRVQIILSLTRCYCTVNHGTDELSR